MNYPPGSVPGDRVTAKTRSLEGRCGDFAVVVLAAGSSTSKGRPHQLLPYLGRTLVEHAVRTALASGASEVVVVVGDHADEVIQRLQRLPVQIVRNRDWSQGISSSIRAGLSRVSDLPGAVIISLCDQAGVTPAHLRELGQRALRPHSPPIIASSYDGVLGAPCAFDRSIFPQLLQLSGPGGARSLIRSATDRVEAIAFAHANDSVTLPDSFVSLVRAHCFTAVVQSCLESCAARAPPPTVRASIAVMRSH